MSEKTEKILTAMAAAGLDPDSIDLPLLVGAFEQIKRWAAFEGHLRLVGKESLCDQMRKTGIALLESYS